MPLIFPDRAPRRAPVGGCSIAYEDSGGDGPALLCLPSSGDLRREYRFLAPLLRAAGRRVLCADLRGHGDSSLGWSRYRPEDVGDDALTVLEDAGVASATLVGCSLSAGSVAWAAARAPGRVSRLVLINPFVTDRPSLGFYTWVARAVIAPPWGRWLYARYHRKNYRLLPADLPEHLALLRRSLEAPGRLEAMRRLMCATKAPVHGALSRVQAPTLVLVGGADPGYADPRRSGEEVCAELGGPSELRILEGLGHYPHVEQPAAVAAALLE